MLVVTETDGKIYNLLYCVLKCALLEIFLPTPNSLLVNLRESKEVYVIQIYECVACYVVY